MYLRRVHFFACVLLLTLSVAVQADGVDDYVKAQMERQHIPGVSIVVIKDQKIVKSMGYGLANAAAIAIGVANFYIPGLLPNRKVAKVDPKNFDSYVGQYQPDPSATLSITREGDKLMVQQGQGEKRQLLPESETIFFIEPTSRTIYNFIKDDSGQMLLVIKQDDREVWRAKKVK